MNTTEQIKELKKKMAMYRKCAQGKPVNCDKCIGCQNKK